MDPERNTPPQQAANLFEGFLRAALSAPRQPIARRYGGAPAPLTSTQLGFWFQALLKPEETPHNVTKALRIRGDLHADVLEQSINHIVQRHSILRTRFVSQEGRPAQEIMPEMHVPLHYYHIGVPEDRTAVLQYARVQEHIRSDNATPFDLSRGPIIRTRLLSIGKGDHLLVFTVHHIGIDGWSIPLFINELTAIYQSLIDGSTPAIPVLPIQFADFAVWQQEWIRGQEAKRQLAFWRQRLDGFPATSTLPPDYMRPMILSNHADHVYQMISSDLVGEIEQYARDENATVFMVLLLALAALLHRRSGQGDLLIGAPVAGRSHAQTRDLIGCFLNTIVIRSNVDVAPTFRELLAQMRREVLEAYSNQDLTFADLVQALRPERTLSHAPLYQVMFNHKVFSKGTWSTDDLVVEELNVKGDGTMLDLVFETSYYGSDLWCTVSYNKHLYKEATIRQLQEDFVALIRAMIADPTQAI